MLLGLLVLGVVVLTPVAERIGVPQPVLLTVYGLALAWFQAFLIRAEPRAHPAAGAPAAALRRHPAHVDPRVRAAAKPILTLAVGLTVVTAALVTLVAVLMGLPWGVAAVLGPWSHRLTRSGHGCRGPPAPATRLVTILQGGGPVQRRHGPGAVPAVGDGSRGWWCDHCAGGVGARSRGRGRRSHRPGGRMAGQTRTCPAARPGRRDHGDPRGALRPVPGSRRGRRLRCARRPRGRPLPASYDDRRADPGRVGPRAVGLGLRGLRRQRSALRVPRHRAAPASSRMRPSSATGARCGWQQRWSQSSSHPGPSPCSPPRRLPADGRGEAVWRCPTDGASQRSRHGQGCAEVVSVATVLALPVFVADGSAFPRRETVVLVALLVVIVTLVVQGLTLAPLIRRLGVGSDEDESARRKNWRAGPPKPGSRPRGADGVPDEIRATVTSQYESRLRHRGRVQDVLTDEAGDTDAAAALRSLLTRAAEASESWSWRRRAQAASVPRRPTGCCMTSRHEPARGSGRPPNSGPCSAGSRRSGGRSREFEPTPSRAGSSRPPL